MPHGVIHCPSGRQPVTSFLRGTHWAVQCLLSEAYRMVVIPSKNEMTKVY